MSLGAKTFFEISDIQEDDIAFKTCHRINLLETG